MWTWPRSKNKQIDDVVRTAGADPGKIRKLSLIFTELRERMVKRVRTNNATTSQEVREAAHFMNAAVEAARAYVQESQRTFSRLQGEGNDSIGQLLTKQNEFLRRHAADMSDRAAVQDERARQAAAAAKSIADLAASIERLAGEARLLAVNARIESSRLGAQSAGFEVLASEMQRLSDEVASTNERVGELAGRLGQDLPWIAQHARDFRRAMEDFSGVASMQLDETERGINELRTQITRASKTGGSAIDDILRASQAALSHLQFQDVVAQDLRAMDGVARQAQVDALTLMEADPTLINDVPDADFQPAAPGGGASGPSNMGGPSSGQVMMF